MFLELEKRIVNNQYTNLNDDTKIWSFGKIDDKIEQVIELREAGKKAHEEGDHTKSEELLIKALNLFKS